MKNVFAIISILMLTIFSSMGQNCVVDELSVPFVEKVGLSPNHSVEENYHKIDSVISLHKEKTNVQYEIQFYGLYESKFVRERYEGHFKWIYFFPIVNRYLGSITKGFSMENDSIASILLELYTYSIDEMFKVSSYEQYYTYISIDLNEYNDYERAYNDVIGNNKNHKYFTMKKNGIIRWSRLSDYVSFSNIVTHLRFNDSYSIIYRLSSNSLLYQKIKEKVIGVTNINSDSVKDTKRQKKVHTKNHKDEITDGIYFKKS